MLVMPKGNLKHVVLSFVTHLANYKGLYAIHRSSQEILKAKVKQ